MINPCKPNGSSHLYQMGKSIFLLSVVGCHFAFYSNFNRTHRGDPGQIPRYAASGLGLPMFHKKQAHLYL